MLQSDHTKASLSLTIDRDAFEKDGFALIKRIVSESQLCELTDSIEAMRSEEPTKAGVRNLLTRCPAVRIFAESEALREIAAKVLGRRAKPVKAILFDKTPDSNWYVTWHQDMTIAVKQRIDAPGFGPWSMKDGIQHVQPPPVVLEKMVSLRVHLDDCLEGNGAIKFVPGSHVRGLLAPSDIAALRDSATSVCCGAERGDIILMRPLILHSSSQSTNPDHRRVLHIEYAAAALPFGLEWAEASGLDSVELVLAIEEEFGLEIPDRDAEQLARRT